MFAMHTSGYTTSFVRTLKEETEQTTAEYALVILAAAAIAVVLIAWPHSSGKLPAFFDNIGLRESEAFGLRWGDVDLDGGLVHIRHQVRRTTGGGFEFVEPKAKASRSTLELTKKQVAMLRKHRLFLNQERLAAGSLWQDHDLVFPSVRGAPIDASNVRAFLVGVCKRAEVRPRRIHDWRITAGPWLADTPIRRREALQALDELFNG